LRSLILFDRPGWRQNDGGMNAGQSVMAILPPRSFPAHRKAARRLRIGSADAAGIGSPIPGQMLKIAKVGNHRALASPSIAPH